MDPNPHIPETIQPPYLEETPVVEEVSNPPTSTPLDDMELSDDDLLFQPREGNQGARIKQLDLGVIWWFWGFGRSRGFVNERTPRGVLYSVGKLRFFSF